ncbi:DUF2066 domain-containing protein [Thalassotalea ganghwensis]
MFACLLSAVEVEDLYSAKILVQSQQSADRTIALKQALTEVFIKIGGNESVIERPLLKSAIRDVSKYVLQYRYQFDDQELSLVATFNESKVNQLFIEADLPIWGKLRPQIVFWVVNETDLNRSLLTSSTESELKDAILLQAKRYGLPALFPIGDIADVEQVSASDVWGRFISPISRASKRYLAEAIVLIRISDHSLLSEQDLITKQTCKLCSKMLVADWGIIDTQKNQLIKSNSYQHTNVNQLISDVVANLSEQLHQRYAYNINENNEYLIDVANVNSLERYAQITEFFRELSVIKSFKLVSALGENRRFKLEILGSKQSLLQSLQLNQSLKQNIDPLAPQVEDEVPVFYWSKP